MKLRLQIDPWLFGPVLLLVLLSLITLFTVNVSFFKSQLASLVIGLLAFFIFSKVNIGFLKSIKLPIYLFSIFFLIVTSVIGIETRGAVRWIDILGLRFQFSEILKPFLSLAFAAKLNEDKDSDLKTFLINVLLIIPIVVLIFIQPDLGSALLYIGASVFGLLVLGIPLLWFFLLAVPFIVVSPILWLGLHEYQRQRIFTFLSKNHDPLGASYNGIQSIIAVGSGLLWGKGISEGTQSILKFLPERHTDFIFATISEGLGFVGASIIIIAFAVLLGRIYVLFRRSDGKFEKAFLSLSFAFLLIQCFVNIGMNIGLLPIVGITLPFVSFGGSSLLSNFIFLGLISAISSKSRREEVLEIK